MIMSKRARERRRLRRFNRRHGGAFPADLSVVRCLYEYAQAVVRQAVWKQIQEDERRLIYGTGTGKPLGIINEKGDRRE